MVFAAEEDFGIVVVEAQAAGTPVICFGKGGVLETVIPGRTGLFYSEQNIASLIHAVDDFDKHAFDPHDIRSHAQQFNRERFVKEFKQFVNGLL